MKLNVCTISFRHQLISFKQIALWAKNQGFQGIELWGVHAKNMDGKGECDLNWLKKQNLAVPMISDYLPLYGRENVAIEKTLELCDLSSRWGTKKIRTFAGDKGSDNIEASERKMWVARLRKLCDVVSENGSFLVVETHPNTLADKLSSTAALIEEVDHPALRINFDVIHVWESGDDVKKALHILEPFICHVHLKNISSKAMLSEFNPANVYAPAGSRSGMVNLFDGTFDFSEFLQYMKTKTRLSWDNLDASLEWFGGDVMNVLQHDRLALENYGLGYSLSERSVGSAVSLA